MRLILIKQAKVVLPGIRDLCQMYETRLQRFYDVECVEQKSGPGKTSKTTSKITSKTTSKSVAASPGVLTVALDEKARVGRLATWPPNCNPGPMIPASNPSALLWATLTAFPKTSAIMPISPGGFRP